MVTVRYKFTAITIASFLVDLKFFTLDTSFAFPASWHLRTPLIGKDLDTPQISRCKTNQRVKPESRIYLYNPSDFGSETKGAREKYPRSRMDRPTETSFDALGPKSIPAKPKIVVLGATGRIGRSVVRQLMEMKNLDIEIVAFVRDYDKAI